MPKPMRPGCVSPYATGERRTRRGLFGFAVCEIKVESPDRSYWKRANAGEWKWCKVAVESEIKVNIRADTSQFQAKIAKVTADLDALAEKAGTLGIVIEVDVGEDDAADQAAIARLEAVLAEAVGPGVFERRAVLDALHRDPSLFR